LGRNISGQKKSMRKAPRSSSLALRRGEKGKRRKKKVKAGREDKPGAYRRPLEAHQTRVRKKGKKTWKCLIGRMKVEALKVGGNTLYQAGIVQGKGGGILPSKTGS